MNSNGLLVLLHRSVQEYCCLDNVVGDFSFYIYLSLPSYGEQAIIKGFWIVFEDIDKAPSDVQSILLPLLEGSSSFSIGHAEVNFVSAF